MWKLNHLEGKYYGTVASNEKTQESVTFWFGFRKYDEDEVSPREKAEGWGDDDIYYDHVEDIYSLDAAITFINAMNAKEQK